MSRLLILPAALALSGCATLLPPPEPPPPPPKAEFIVPEGSEFISSLFGYSQAARVGPWIRVSAQPGFDTQKRGFPDTLKAQATKAFENLAIVLQAAGARMEDVVEITSYQLDMSQFSVVVGARNQAFGMHRLTWTAVGVSALPLPSMLIQVSATAYVPGGGSSNPVAASAATEEVEDDNAGKKRATTPFVNRPGY